MKTDKQNQEDLMFAHLGNGVTIYDRLRKEYGDYMMVAHISYNRTVKYYQNVSEEGRNKIEHFAKFDNMNMSQTQPYPVLEPINQ